MFMRRYARCALVAGMLLVLVSAAQKKKPYRRAAPPKFDHEQTSRVFFDNAFKRAIGPRPSAKANAAGKAVDGVPQPVPSQPVDGGEFGWSRIISASTLEDEIKSLKLEIDKAVTTPSSFAGRGHKPARRAFLLLASLFAIIDQYDGEVRWKSDAAALRDQLARTGANLKAGGSVQVYNESKKRRQDLDDLVRGSRLQGQGEETPDWSKVVDRNVLMQWLESRLEANLKQWTNNKQDFTSRADEVEREAELVAAFGRLLMQEGVDDADDEEYQAFCKMLENAGVTTAKAAKARDIDQAQRGMTEISRACADCHDDYR